ncbi:MAG: hypothetical protein K5872_05190 [Rhizobiaceae bacterium]|nr:hypothetical protein [Rhizobiaceae bacterium]
METLAQEAGLKTDMKVGHIVRGVLEACEPQEQALYEHLARDEAREWRERLDQRVFPAIRRRLSDRIIMTVLHARVSRR